MNTKNRELFIERAKLYFKRFEKLSDSMKDQINSFAPRF